MRPPSKRPAIDDCATTFVRGRGCVLGEAIQFKATLSENSSVGVLDEEGVRESGSFFRSVMKKSDEEMRRSKAVRGRKKVCALNQNQ